MPESLLAAIEASPPAAALRTSFVAYPLVNAAHILGAGGLVATVWLMHAAMADRGPFVGVPGLDRLFRGIVVAVIVFMAVSGFALFSVKAGDYAANPAFRLKMILILTALANVALFHAVRARWARFATALMSCLLWPAVLLAGRFIAFL